MGACRRLDKEGRENVAVVHAKVPMMMEGRTLGHAWVEYDKPTDGGTQRMVSDLENFSRDITTEEYYGAFEDQGGVQDARSYSPTEYFDRWARNNRERTGPAYGPWDDE